MKLEANISDQAFADAEALAAAASMSRDDYIDRAIAAYNARQRRKAVTDAEIIAAYDAMADDPEMQLSEAQKARRYERLRAIEW